MRAKTQTREFHLRAEEIDRFSDWLERVQLEMGIDEKGHRLRVRLYVEELLLRLRDRFGEELSVKATCENLFQGPRLTLETRCSRFNPLSVTNEDLGSWESSLATAIGYSPQYSYEDGCNKLRLRLPKTQMNPIIRIAIAIALGALFGVAGLWAIPDEVRQQIARILLTPLYEMWNRLLNAISGPIVFLTVATAMLNARTIDERGGSSAIVIARYFGLSIAVVALALFTVLPVFYLGFAEIVLTEGLLSDLFDVLLQVVPSNILDPFINSNTSQLLFLAFALGFVLVRLGERTETLKELIRESNVVGLKMAEWVSMFVPYVTGSFVCLELWQERPNVLGRLWQPVVVSLALLLVTILIIGLIVCRRLRVRPLLLFKKLWSPFAVALAKGSLNESFELTQRTSTSLLGINADYVHVSLPQGLVLYMPASAIGTIVFTLFVAREMGIHASSVWYVAAIVMSVVVFVATPPVPGANLLAYVVLFTTLGIHNDALLDAMIFDVIFGIVAGAANQTMLQLEMLLQADRFGLLDRKALRKPLAE